MSKPATFFILFLVLLFLFGAFAFVGWTHNEPEPKRCDLKPDSVKVAQDTVIMSETFTFRTRISVYNPSRKNTTGDTLQTADGSKIDPLNPQRWIAVTEKWLEFFPYGSRVWIVCYDVPYINGWWDVHDTGCAEGIDILISNPIKCRIEFLSEGFVSNKPIKSNKTQTHESNN